MKISAIYDVLLPYTRCLVSGEHTRGSLSYYRCSQRTHDIALPAIGSSAVTPASETSTVARGITDIFAKP